MATYCYKCPECSGRHDYEIPMRDVDSHKEVCPEDGTEMIRIIAGNTTVIFLGPGFASNDHVARPNVGRNSSNQNRYSV
jgi:predicted nucleic acid-binding Zn ribbon protein